MNGITRKEILTTLVPQGFRPGSFNYFVLMAGVPPIERRNIKNRLVAFYPADATEKIKKAWKQGGMHGQ